jgi:probable HAF family extracellular repeat protein
VTGSEHPPEVLALWEVDAQGQRTAIGNLLDNQENGDLVKGDGFYSGTFTLDAVVEGEKRYLVTAAYQGMAVESPLSALVVTSFPIGPAPLNEADAIQDPDTQQKFAPGEILVKFNSGTPRLEIDNILANQQSTVIGSLPEIGVLEVTVPGIGATDVRHAVAIFRNLPQVEFAEPNVLLATGTTSPDRPCPNTNTNTSADINCDWAVIRVRANDAWDLSKGARVRVAVVDKGEHGYKVAQLIGAKLDGGGITGIAPEATVTDYFNKTTYTLDIADAISAANVNQNKIINLSIWEECATDDGTDTGNCIGLQASNDLYSDSNKDTVCKAIQSASNDLLFVTIAGNHNNKYSKGFQRIEPRLSPCVHAKNGLVVGATNYANKLAARKPALACNQADPSGWSCSEPGSGYGSWVDIVAPGENVCVGVDASGKCIWGTGTSFAAPQVSGAAALLFAQHPYLNAGGVATRLKNTAKPPLPASEFYPDAGLLDVFYAVSTTLILNVPGASDTIARGINDMGQTVGWWVNSSVSNVEHGFLYDVHTNTYDTLNFPNALHTQAYGINNNGQVVGYYAKEVALGTRQTALYGFLYDKTRTPVFTTLDVPGSSGTLAYGINDKGQVVGSYLDSTLASHGFLYDETQKSPYKTFDFQNSSGTYAYDINNNGQIVGQFYLQGSTPANHNFLCGISMDNSCRQLTININAAGFDAFGINDYGQIVGEYWDSPLTAIHAFIYDDSSKTAKRFDYPNTTETDLSGINNSGQLVGTYRMQTPQMSLRGFIEWSP